MTLEGLIAEAHVEAGRLRCRGEAPPRPLRVDQLPRSNLPFYLGGALSAQEYRTAGRRPWCFGRHDSPWPAWPLFGTVRSMVASSLWRKFDVERYAAEVEALYTERVKETP